MGGQKNLILKADFNNHGPKQNKWSESFGGCRNCLIEWVSINSLTDQATPLN